MRTDLYPHTCTFTITHGSTRPRTHLCWRARLLHRRSPLPLLPCVTEPHDICTTEPKALPAGLSSWHGSQAGRAGCKGLGCCAKKQVGWYCCSAARLQGFVLLPAGAGTLGSWRENKIRHDAGRRATRTHQSSSQANSTWEQNRAAVETRGERRVWMTVTPPSRRFSPTGELTIQHAGTSGEKQSPRR